MLAHHDFAPDFILPTPAGVVTRFFGIAGGRITLLAFLSSGDDAGLCPLLSSLASELDLAVFVVHGQAPSVTRDQFPTVVDQDGAVGQRYGVNSETCVFLLSENLRVLEVFCDLPPAQCGAAIRNHIHAMANVDAPREPGHAPVLLIPHVLDDDFCDRLIGVAQAGGLQQTGVEVSRAGKRTSELSWEMKRRRDYTVADTPLLSEITRRVGRRVIPEVWKAFSFHATRFEGFKVGCYESETHDCFRPHRDNLSPATAHRQFALSLNLSDDYTGGELRFPEYGPGRYRPAKGGAIIFSGSLLHEALDVTEGRRFVLLSFLYRQEDGRRTPARPGEPSQRPGDAKS